MSHTATPLGGLPYLISPPAVLLIVDLHDAATATTVSLNGYQLCNQSIDGQATW